MNTKMTVFEYLLCRCVSPFVFLLSGLYLTYILFCKKISFEAYKVVSFEMFKLYVLGIGL